MKTTTKMLVIAKDDFPLETFMGFHPITNFIRRLLFADHKECHKCYEERKGMKVSNERSN